MNLAIQGMGVATPPHTMSQAEALALAEAVLQPDEQQARLLKVIYRRSGVNNRHTCVPHRLGVEWASLPPHIDEEGTAIRRGASTRTRMSLFEEHAGPLAVEAARGALERSDVSPDRITHVVTVSCTGFQGPGVDVSLIKALSLPVTAERINVGFMGCHGAINGLRVCSALAKASPQNRVLMCAVELCCLHYYFDWSPDKLVSNALFADGAAAMVGFGDEGRGGRAKVVATGSCLLPESEDAMTWKLGDYGFEMTLCATVPDRIRADVRPWVTSWLREHGVELEDVRHWIVHPGGPRIVGAVEKAFDLPPEATAVSRSVLSDYGNMSSPTVLFILNRLPADATGPCVMIGFGPGLAAEAALLMLS